jgi:hypothetical protein
VPSNSLAWWSNLQGPSTGESAAEEKKRKRGKVSTGIGHKSKIGKLSNLIGKWQAVKKVWPSALGLQT